MNKYLISPESGSTELADGLINAYLNTHYEVVSEPPFILKVGEYSADLKTFSEVTKGFLYITACNPLGTELEPQENDERMWYLSERLQKLGKNLIYGFGKDPAGEWPGEHSLLAFDVNFDEACMLGRTFEQNAVVWVNMSLVPRLVLLR